MAKQARNQSELQNYGSNGTTFHLRPSNFNLEVFGKGSKTVLLGLDFTSQTSWNLFERCLRDFNIVGFSASIWSDLLLCIRPFVSSSLVPLANKSHNMLNSGPTSKRAEQI